jgi:hypothetical protein
MSNQRFDSRRTRALLGGAVVMVSLAAAGVLGGVGLAKGSVTAAQYQYGKIVICHKTHSKKNPQVTITISQSAWKAHQKHGDTLGACTAPTTTTTGATTTTAATPAASPGKSGEPHGKGGQPHGNSGGHGKGHG